MCDVDNEAVVSAPDAPSIYDIPKVLHAEGLDAYVVRRLGLPFRDVDWTRVGRAAAPRAPPGPRGHHRAGRQVRRPARRLPVGRPRRCAPAASPTTPRSTSAGSPPTTAQTPRARRATLDGVDGVLVPGGFGVRGIEGKLGARPARPRARHPDARPVPRPAVHGHRGRPRPGRPGRRQLARSSTPTTAAPGDRDDGRPARRRRRRARHGRHHAARARTRPTCSPAAWSCARPYGRSVGRRAPPPPLRGQQRLPRALEEAGLVFSGTSPDGRLVEFVELPREVHPFFVGTQAHPEFKSRPTRPHPLFSGLVAAALERAEACAADRSWRPAAAASARAGARWDG